MVKVLQRPPPGRGLRASVRHTRAASIGPTHAGYQHWSETQPARGQSEMAAAGPWSCAASMRAMAPRPGLRPRTRQPTTRGGAILYSPGSADKPPPARNRPRRSSGGPGAHPCLGPVAVTTGHFRPNPKTVGPHQPKPDVGIRVVWIVPVALTHTSVPLIVVPRPPAQGPRPVPAKPRYLGAGFAFPIQPPRRLPISVT